MTTPPFCLPAKDTSTYLLESCSPSTAIMADHITSKLNADNHLILVNTLTLSLSLQLTNSPPGPTPPPPPLRTPPKELQSCPLQRREGEQCCQDHPQRYRQSIHQFKCLTRRSPQECRLDVGTDAGSQKETKCMCRGGDKTTPAIAEQDTPFGGVVYHAES